jgi:hypothetical protein
MELTSKDTWQRRAPSGGQSANPESGASPGYEFLNAFEDYASRAQAKRESTASGAPRVVAPPWQLTVPAWAILAVSVAIGLGVCAITAVVELGMFREGSSAEAMMISSDIIAGLLAGALYYKTIQSHRRRRAMVLHRLKIIAAMNHHIRNALELILLSTATPPSPEITKNIYQATSRITWALQEILGIELPEE